MYFLEQACFLCVFSSDNKLSSVNNNRTQFISIVDLLFNDIEFIYYVVLCGNLLGAKQCFLHHNLQNLMTSPLKVSWNHLNGTNSPNFLKFDVSLPLHCLLLKGLLIPLLIHNNLTKVDQVTALASRSDDIQTLSGVSRAYISNLYSFTPLPLQWILSSPLIGFSERKWLKQRNKHDMLCVF